MTHLDIGLIGYGEVGKIFSNGLKAKGLSWVGAWDVIFGDAVFGGAQRLHASAHGETVPRRSAKFCERSACLVDRWNTGQLCGVTIA